MLKFMDYVKSKKQTSQPSQNFTVTNISVAIQYNKSCSLSLVGLCISSQDIRHSIAELVISLHANYTLLIAAEDLNIGTKFDSSNIHEELDFNQPQLQLCFIRWKVLDDLRTSNYSPASWMTLDSSNVQSFLYSRSEGQFSKEGVVCHV
ncbi:hypothetical protein KL938_002922 [Ogataea parapolymorpha]|nr:hypothetical protein KL938_002922 [Ogataea parapolymorpha]